ncbi:hypothetical protein DPMN_083163 [Dreissena polymorpha]|uniref:Uncharacterized protein n=1 Tax=Dreissena polymorpha TaxID=45954 RepID=A0A9D3Y8U1_DREPO|nr:hypothetical protein DPMN_083163 [Dreissena polymorpha]
MTTLLPEVNRVVTFSTPATGKLGTVTALLPDVNKVHRQSALLSQVNRAVTVSTPATGK